MSADGHGLPDNAIRGAHDMIHHAEQEEHEHEAAQKRGLTDQAVEAEHEFMEHQEDELAKLEVRYSSTDFQTDFQTEHDGVDIFQEGQERKWT
ncbi:hypothetical protein F4679DRAFT_549287 [Xylaria curta]|nr:hypothetical protein F4679DRAFT_549287 [Xylaria curta]